MGHIVVWPWMPMVRSGVQRPSRWRPGFYSLSQFLSQKVEWGKTLHDYPFKYALKVHMERGRKPYRIRGRLPLQVAASYLDRLGYLLKANDQVMGCLGHPLYMEAFHMVVSFKRPFYYPSVYGMYNLGEVIRHVCCMQSLWLFWLRDILGER